MTSPVVKLSDSTLSGAGNFEFTSEAFFGARFQSNAYKFMAGNNSTEYMRITSSGDVNFSGGAVRADGGYFAVRTSGGSAAIGYILREATWLGSGTSTNLSLAAEGGNALTFFTNGTTSPRMTITSNGTLAIGTTDIPTLSTPNGGQLTVMPNAVIVSGIIALGSPYTQNIQIDVVYNNWGGNNVIGLVDMIITLREYANTSGTAFGKIFATNSSGGATFASFNTTDVTTSQCSVTAVSGGNYTLRITIDPSNVTDRGSFYLIIPNAGGTGSSISSITVSYV